MTRFAHCSYNFGVAKICKNLKQIRIYYGIFFALFFAGLKSMVGSKDDLERNQGRIRPSLTKWRTNHHGSEENMHRCLNRLPIWVFLIFIFFLQGCSSTQSVGPQGMQGPMAAQPIGDYRLRPGDEIEVKFFYHGDLNETLMVGPDGKIALQLIDQVLVAGLTPAQVDALLTREYAKYLENYEISVIVREYSGLRVFVGGEVNEPGFISLKGNMTALQSIFSAKGHKRTGKLENVVLIRKGPDSRPNAMVLDLAAAMSGEALENDIYLMPSDIVYVPQTWIGKAGDFVDLYLRRVLFVDSIMDGVGNALGYKWIIDD
jgi:protein involved in polysaccharide export with SLBB domain